MWPLLQAAGPFEGYFLELLRLALALGAVCLLAVAVLKWMARRGLGSVRPGRIQVLERVVLEPRRVLYLVRVDDRLLLLGGGETGAPQLLCDLEAGPGNEPAQVQPAQTATEDQAGAGAGPAAPQDSGAGPQLVAAALRRLGR